MNRRWPRWMECNIAATVNGGIESDFPLTVTGRFGPRRVSGTIGGGGRDLRLETVNGGIHIRQGR